jgi:hypothetical protein
MLILCLADGPTSESSEVLSKPSLWKFSAERQWTETQERTKKSDIRIEPLTFRQKRSGEHIRGSKSCKCKVDPRPERLTSPRHGHAAPKLQSNLKLRLNTNSAWSGGKCPCNCISLHMCMSPQKRWQRSLIPRWVQLVTLVQWLDSRCEGFVGIMQVSSLSNSNLIAQHLEVRNVYAPIASKYGSLSCSSARAVQHHELYMRYVLRQRRGGGPKKGLRLPNRGTYK